MFESWSLIIDICLIGVFLLLAAVIRRYIPFFKRFRIPDAIVAGFLALAVGPNGFNLIPEFIRVHGEFSEAMAPLQSGTLITLVYHLMGIAFIALALKSSEGRGRTRSAVSGGFYMVVSYAIQGLVGLGLTLILMLTFFPKLFPSFGFLLPFGFAQGPGLASQMGKLWSAINIPGTTQSAFPHGASVGLSFSTIGFLWACIVGVPLMNILLRRRKRMGEPEPGLETKPAHFFIEKERDYSGMSRSVDKLTTQLMLVGSVYAILLVALEGLSWFMRNVVPGAFGENMLKILWGFHFGFGALIGTGVGKLIRKLEDKKIIKGNRGTNNYLLQHIGGTAIDFMIASSIAAINIKVLGPYISPILIVSTIGGLVTMGYVWIIARKVWPRTYVEHFVTFFGTHTGTLATGMALLRGVDPQFKTSAASDAVYGSGIGLMMGIPLIGMASLPATGYEEGNPNMYWITILAMTGYLAVALGAWILFLVLTKHRKKQLEGR
ncbi:sodium:glutamate symporter [candidate division WOR-3 bacterium]|uniref:Sodium:glutamate symporter n=1 Tax=candidate division WOR-3 bacterium TaxID=2052148 RepID=A0A9D5K8K0_UNCW3|nr:sodium:glutamate symporter [candidate division WOR-3 bacterium]MBD3364327.1 sodium:glutamate symporter [candidate division WOR-3 bacterium]